MGKTSGTNRYEPFPTKPLEAVPFSPEEPFMAFAELDEAMDEKLQFEPFFC